jgi:Flp pilus assembly protein TadG
MVEFAIILPLLLLILVGILDMGRLLLAQAMVTNAAREGARMAALGYTGAQLQARVNESLPGIATLAGGSTVVVNLSCPTVPTPTSNAAVTVSTTGFTWVALDGITGLFGAAIDTPQPSSRASMRCSG